MAFDTLRKIIADKVIAEWTITALGRVVFGDNRKPKNTSTSPWVRVSYTIIDKKNAQIGTDFQRSIGFINVQVFVPALTGEKLALQIVDHVVSIFENKTFNGLKCYMVKPIRVGTANKTYQMNARVDFEYDVIS